MTVNQTISPVQTRGDQQQSAASKSQPVFTLTNCGKKSKVSVCKKNSVLEKRKKNKKCLRCKQSWFSVTHGVWSSGADYFLSSVWLPKSEYFCSAHFVAKLWTNYGFATITATFAEHIWRHLINRHFNDHDGLTPPIKAAANRFSSIYSAQQPIASGHQHQRLQLTWRWTTVSTAEVPSPAGWCVDLTLDRRAARLSILKTEKCPTTMHCVFKPRRQRWDTATVEYQQQDNLGQKH